MLFSKAGARHRLLQSCQLKGKMISADGRPLARRFKTLYHPQATSPNFALNTGQNREK
jgi:hypothetical protein